MHSLESGLLNLRKGYNKSLAASGGGVFRNLTGPAMLDLNSRRRVNSAVGRLPVEALC